jgi:hypothetical protein
MMIFGFVMTARFENAISVVILKIVFGFREDDLSRVQDPLPRWRQLHVHLCQLLTL